MTDTTLTETAVTISIDGQPVQVAEGSTIHAACVQAGIDTPTLCWAENLTPGQRLPGLCGGTGGVAGPGALVLAPG